MEEIILVNEKDNETGSMEKLKAHENGGTLHRAFSIFLFNSEGRMLLQKRAEGKYHCAGLWTNTCCSHQHPGETLEEAAHRRLRQEMGLDTGLREILKFIYRAEFENGLTEHEFDHVFVGRYDGEVSPNPEEVGDHKWVDVKHLKKDIAKNPEKYTPWFRIALDRVVKWLDTGNLCELGGNWSLPGKTFKKPE